MLFLSVYSCIRRHAQFGGALQTSLQFWTKYARTIPRAYESWSSEEDERLKEMQRAGRSISELASNIGRQPGAIRSRLRKLGIELEIPEGSTIDQTRQFLQQGMTIEEVAQRRGFTNKTIAGHIERLIQSGEASWTSAHFDASTGAVRHDQGGFRRVRRHLPVTCQRDPRRRLLLRRNQTGVALSWTSRKRGRTHPVSK